MLYISAGFLAGTCMSKEEMQRMNRHVNPMVGWPMSLTTALEAELHSE